MAGTARTRRRHSVRAARSPAGHRAPARAPGSLPVQLLPHLLAAGELPRARVGEVLAVVPAVYAGIRHEAGPFHGSPAPDHWSVDEFGCLDARGTVTAVALDPAGGCTCRIDVLDAAGWLVPVNWAGTEPPEGDGPPHVEGSLYLDPGARAGSRRPPRPPRTRSTSPTWCPTGTTGRGDRGRPGRGERVVSTCAHSGWTTRAQARVREVTTVQLQRRHLRAGRLPVVAGHVADLLGAVRAQP